MSPLLYLGLGLIAGGLFAAVIFSLRRRVGSGSDVQTELVKRLEILDRGLRDEFSRNREEGASAAKSHREELGKSLEGVRAIVDLRLKELQQDNAKQIDKMRATVDEKLQGTLEKRLGESFKLVSDRLEQVHKGLGAMQQLASDVGGDYQRLLAAQDKGDVVGIDDAMKSLETQLKKSAKDICQKYINPPRTTDFALMFLPTEGLYAEAIRRVGLVEQVQRDCRVIFAGPTTLAALLNSLQMGFRTLAIQKRSSEVWNLLAAVKTEFGKFGEALSAVKDKLDQAARHVDTVAVRSRAITKKLRDVEELPSNPQPLLKDLLGDSDED